MAQEEPHTNSVFDFLYSDKRRIKSWIAQIFPDGVLASHSRTSQTGGSKGNEISGEIDASAGVSALVADAKVKGSAKAASKTDEIQSSSHSKSFDTSWSLELDLLDKLDELGMIHRDIASASIGSLILASGVPKLIDVRFIQEMWDSASELMHMDRKITNKNKTQVALEKKAMKDIGSVFKKLPPTPQLYMLDGDDNNIWACFDEKYMIVNPASLALMHGTIVKGKWHILGVLDAYPDSHENDSLAIEIEEQYPQNDFLVTFSEVAQMVRQLMGRPSVSYGITPLLIFRKIK